MNRQIYLVFYWLGDGASAYQLGFQDPATKTLKSNTNNSLCIQIRCIDSDSKESKVVVDGENTITYEPHIEVNLERDDIQTLADFAKYKMPGNLPSSPPKDIKFASIDQVDSKESSLGSPTSKRKRSDDKS